MKLLAIGDMVTFNRKVGTTVVYESISNDNHFINATYYIGRRPVRAAVVLSSCSSKAQAKHSSFLLVVRCIRRVVETL